MKSDQLELFSEALTDLATYATREIHAIHRERRPPEVASLCRRWNRLLSILNQFKTEGKGQDIPDPFTNPSGWKRP